MLREQGVNGQVEMAAAFDRAGFDAFDVHMSDIIAGRASIWSRFTGIVAVRRLLLRRRARRGRGLGEVDPVQRARARRVRRVLRARRHLRARRVQRLPDDEQPARAHSRARRTGRISCATAPSSSKRGWCMVEVQRSPSMFFAGMAGSRIPIAIAHGEGYAEFRDAEQLRAAATAGGAALRRQPRQGDRALSVQPQRLAAGHHRLDHGRRPLHDPDAAPERVFRTVQMSWHPDEWGEDSPWMRMFRNARAWRSR